MKTGANSSLARRWALVLVAAVGIAATSFAGTISASSLDGLVAWWRADGSALDSAAGYHGDLPYGIAYAPGHSGECFDFDGSRRRVSITDHPAFYLTNSLTLECWVYPRRWGGFIVFRGDNRSGLDPWQLDAYEPGYVRFNIINAANQTAAVLAPLRLHQWQHVAATWEGETGEMRLYVNGDLAARTNTAIRPLAELNPDFEPAVGIGNHGGTFHLFPFDGLIDEVAVYARALRAEEIAQRALVEELPPTITIAPLQQAVPLGGTAQFTATASGSPPLAFQWHFDGQPIPGATGTALVLSNVQPAQAGQYSVTVSNAWGTASSSNAVLTVLTMAPAFSLHPTNLTVRVGATATLTARALAIPGPVYQWFFNGSPLSGHTTTALVLSNVQPAHAGTYWVVASNLFGVATSSNATLMVLPPPACVPLPAGAVAWWRGESNSLDSIGGFDALPIPYSLAFTAGKVGTALLFTGRNDYTVPAAPGLDLGAGDGFTIEGWIAPRLAPAFEPLVGWNDSWRAGVALVLNRVLSYNTNVPVLEAQFLVTNPPGPRMIAFRSPPGALTIATQAWSHVALTYDKSSGLAALYLNGAVVAQTNLGSFRPQTQYPLDLGFQPSSFGWGMRFQGAMDEITLYNRALTGAEIQRIVGADSAGKCAVATPPHCQNISAALAGWWRGESNTLDSVAYHHGSMSPGSLPWAQGYSNGLFGACFALRSGNYVVIPATPNLDVGAGEGLTVEAWVRPVTTSYPIVEWNSGTGTQGVFLAYSATRGPNYLEANLVDVEGNAHWVISPFLPTAFNQWRHVAVTYDRGSGLAVIYTNGTAAAQTNLGSFTPRTTGKVYLGYRPPGNYPGSGQQFNGYLDEVAVYRRALTAAEVRCIYLSGAMVKYPPPVPCVPPPPEIVGWWRFESNALDSVQDNHGYALGNSFAPGKVGSALATGVRQFAYITQRAGLNVGVGPGLTLEAWLNPAETNWGAIANWEGGLTTTGVRLEYNHPPGPGNLRATLPGTSGSVGHVVSSPGVIKTGQWQHVALTYDRASGWGQLFVNGSPVAATNLGAFTPVTTGSFYVGWRPGQPYFRSALDEVAVYGRALQPFEIYSISQAAQGRCMEPPTILLHPVSQRVNAGSTVTFTAQAVGNPMLRYHWGYGPYFPQRPSLLPGQTNTVLVLTNVQANHERAYWVLVTNAFGVAVSSNALLEVNYPPVADPSATRLSYIVRPECAPVSVVLDGSRSSDPDGDPLQYFWFRTGETNALATGVVAVVSLPVGSYSLTLVVDDGLATGTETFTVELLTPGQAVERLITLVNARVARSRPLVATLEAARAAIERGNRTAAINDLGAFQNKVRAQVTPDDAALAAQLIQTAQEVVDALTQDCGATAVRPKIGRVQREGNKPLRIEFSASAGRVYLIEASSNLVDWEKIGVARESGAGEFLFEDTHAPGCPVRFYRIVSP